MNWFRRRTVSLTIVADGEEHGTIALSHGKVTIAKVRGIAKRAQKVLDRFPEDDELCADTYLELRFGFWSYRLHLRQSIRDAVNASPESAPHVAAAFMPYILGEEELPPEVVWPRGVEYADEEALH